MTRSGATEARMEAAPALAYDRVLPDMCDARTAARIEDR